MHEEGTAVFFLPIFEDLTQVALDLGQLFCNTLAHLLFTQEARRVTLLALLTTKHETRGVLRRSSQVIAIFDERAVLVDHGQSRCTLLLEGLESANLGLVSFE